MGSSDQQLSHIDASGRARMVDVGDKDVSDRLAIAEGFVRVSGELAQAIRDNSLAKGDLISTARLAGVMAAKRTGELVPLCHPLPIDHADVEITLQDNRVHIVARVRTRARTGVEMEALTAVSVAGLTVIDMGKALDKGMTIEGVRVIEKKGGRSGHYVASGVEPTS